MSERESNQESTPNRETIRSGASSPSSGSPSTDLDRTLSPPPASKTSSLRPVFGWDELVIPPTSFKDTSSLVTFEDGLVDEISRLYIEGYDLRHTKRVVAQTFSVGEEVVSQQMELPSLLDRYSQVQSSILMRSGPPGQIALNKLNMAMELIGAPFYGVSTGRILFETGPSAGQATGQNATIKSNRLSITIKVSAELLRIYELRFGDRIKEHDRVAVWYHYQPLDTDVKTVPALVIGRLRR